MLIFPDRGKNFPKFRRQGFMKAEFHFSQSWEKNLSKLMFLTSNFVKMKVVIILPARKIKLTRYCTLRFDFRDFQEEVILNFHIFLTYSTNTDIMDGHMMRVFSVQFNPWDDHVFVSGGWDDTIQVRI